MLYLDNSATTKVLQEVYNEMIPYICEYYGNPNSKYYEQALTSKKAVDIARERIAKLLNCNSEEIVFTSGASESNNLILKGYTHTNKGKKNHIIVSAIEHSCIIETAKFLENEGFEVTFLPVNKKGIIDLQDLENAINDKTLLVSIMWANNELGTINDIEKISEICHKNGVKFHTDATQFVGKGIVDLKKLNNIDFLTMSAHKIYGPKGIGLLFIKRDECNLFPTITPLIHGGGQEFGIRSGTLAVHQIVGFGKAAEIIFNDLEKNIVNLKEVENKFIIKMESVFGDHIVINNDYDNKIPGLVSLRIKGYNNQLFLKNASTIISASTGSACSNSKPSYVLKECGYTDEEIRETIRFSMSAYEDYNDFKDIQ